ncbi:MAG TPA: dienelactone hydrolase family protein [Actinomycetota bacterium]|nr:dienelactone hydrolase family protein [Actinomycetota bacterium]
MCFDTDALPPDPARTGMLAGTERSTLEAADGNRFAVTIARSHQDPAPGIVIIPDVRGLHRYYERLSEHVADAGIHAIALDPYGRTAGAHHREDGFEYQEHRTAVRDAGIREDVRAAGDVLRGMGASSVVSMGFCFGGRASLMQASQDGSDGVIAFYGPPTRGENGERSPLDEARSGAVRAPVLGLYGGADRGIPPADVEAYEQALEAAGVDHRIVVFPGAPHSFFDRSMSEHAEACREAWSNVLGFVDSLGR